MSYLVEQLPHCDLLRLSPLDWLICSCALAAFRAHLQETNESWSVEQSSAGQKKGEVVASVSCSGGQARNAWRVTRPGACLVPVFACARVGGRGRCGAVAGVCASLACAAASRCRVGSCRCEHGPGLHARRQLPSFTSVNLVGHPPSQAAKWPESQSHSPSPRGEGAKSQCTHSDFAPSPLFLPVRFHMAPLGEVGEVGEVGVSMLHSPLPLPLPLPDWASLCCMQCSALCLLSWNK